MKQFGIVLLLSCIWTGTASAIPMDYVIAGPDGATGTFQVDPTLAAPLGEDFLLLSDWSITLQTAFEPAPFVIGPVDLLFGALGARFLDGQLAGIDSGSASAELIIGPETYGFALSIDARALSAGAIDPTNAGEFNVITFRTSDGAFENNCCSYGFSDADDSPGGVVPEPTAAVLFGAGTLMTAAALRRRGDTVQRRFSGDSLI
jgi:hypothetical protein